MTHNEMPKDTVEGLMKPFDGLQDFPLTANPDCSVSVYEAIEEALTTAYNKGVEVGREDCQISNFKCSQHGKITPRPICPKCIPDTSNTTGTME